MRVEYACLGWQRYVRRDQDLIGPRTVIMTAIAQRSGQVTTTLAPRLLAAGLWLPVLNPGDGLEPRSD